MEIGPWIAYFVTIVTYFFIYNILTWGLNIQFGYTGIPNFTYITFMAIGAYFTGVLSLPPPLDPHFTHYILGLHWAFPWSLLGGAIAASGLGILIGVVTLRRLRSDYLAIVTFSLGFLIYDYVSTDVRLFNGFEGLEGVAPPLNDLLQLDVNSYSFVFLGITAIIMCALWVAAEKIYRSPLGRTLRAIREDLDAAEALGKNTFRFRMIALVIGCFYAGIAGGLTIEFVSAMNPSGWGTPETFVIWAALLLGGRANNLGVVLGSFVVPVLLFQGIQFLPIATVNAQTLAQGQLIVVGVILMVVLWFRPQGLIPERRRRFYEIPVGTPRGVEVLARSR